MKHIFSCILSLFTILSVTSCMDESSTAGSKWIESSLLNAVTDTFTVRMNTILADSIATSSDTICQIGHFNSSLYGDITTSFYAEYEVPSASFSEDVAYAFDSITIRLYTCGNYLGDTLASQRINLYQLVDNLPLYDDYLYNTSTVAYSPTLLGSFSYQPTPGQRTKEHEIRLPDAWGKKWFDLLANESRYVESQENFRDYFPGIAFIPEASGNCVTGFQVSDSSLCVTVYYHKLAEITEDLTLTFTPSNTYSYNKVHTERQNTYLSELKPGFSNASSSDKTGYMAYLQGMTGTYINIEFPTLNELCSLGEIVTIESALLRLYPVRGTYNGAYPLPSSLSLYTADENNVTQDAITNSAGTSVQTGNLVIDELAYEDTYYSFDITSFLQTNLGTTGYNRQILQLIYPNGAFTNTLQSVVFGDNENTAVDKNVKLTILYKVYNR